VTETRVSNIRNKYRTKQDNIYSYLTSNWLRGAIDEDKRSNNGSIPLAGVPELICNSASHFHRVIKMMRKIEREMIEAIKAQKNYSNDNTRVAISSNGEVIKIELHGQTIASIENNFLYLDDCGYQTKTTKSRLNRLLNHYHLPTICSKKGKWWIGSSLWLGHTSFILILGMNGNKVKESLQYAAVLGGQSQPRPYDAVLGGKTLKSGLSSTF